MEKFYSVLGNILEFVINNYSDEISYLIFLAIAGVLGWLISTVKSSIIKAALEKIYTAVMFVKQTVVDDLKDKTKDGVFDAKERAEAKEKAKKVFLDQFGIVGKFILSLIVGPIEKWFEIQAEVILGEIKKKSSTTAPPSSPGNGQ